MVRCQRNSSSPKPIGDFTSENAPHSKGCACSRRSTPAKACRRVSRGLRHRLSPTLGGRRRGSAFTGPAEGHVERRDHERHRFLRAVAPRRNQPPAAALRHPPGELRASARNFPDRRRRAELAVIEYGSTIAEGASIAKPARMREVLAAVRRSGRRTAAMSENEIDVNRRRILTPATFRRNR